MAKMTRKDLIFLEIADNLGSLSTCDRAYIGAVVTREGRCVCWGYNGAPPGLPHCDENEHGWAGRGGSHITDRGCRNATHAEANALAAAAKQGISTDDGTLYVSQSPCLNCARLLIAAGIVRVVYGTMYRDTSGIDLLKTAGVECTGPR
jgi:dCMP deaminase